MVNLIFFYFFAKCKLFSCASTDDVKKIISLFFSLHHFLSVHLSKKMNRPEVDLRIQAFHIVKRCIVMDIKSLL